MPGSCCAKPVTKIIDVGGIQVGLMGLETAFVNTYLLDIKDETKLREELLGWIKQSGNYITESREEDYKEALLREYKIFLDKKIKEEKTITKRDLEKTKQKEISKTKKRNWLKKFFNK